MNRVLVVDDEPQILRALAINLRARHYEVFTATNGADALATAASHPPDLVVLDLGLPDIDGVEVCRRVREFSDAHVLMLTAQDTELDKVVGFEAGADDYVTKPFGMKELLARIRAALRRAPTAPGLGPQTFSSDYLEVDFEKRLVRAGGNPVRLTPKEFDLRDTLTAAPRVAFSRAQLLERVWGENWFGDDHLVDVHISNLRRKLADDPRSPAFVATVRGVGYRMGAGR